MFILKYSCKLLLWRLSCNLFYDGSFRFIIKVIETKKEKGHVKSREKGRVL